MRIYKGKPTGVNFDEKCITILEKLNSNYSAQTTADLYLATKPTQYPAFDKRIDEMKEAKLIKTVSGCPGNYEITGRGKRIAKLLRLKERSFAELVGEEGMDVEAASRYVGSLEKASPEQIKEMENQRRSRI